MSGQKLEDALMWVVILSCVVAVFAHIMRMLGYQ
jgi:hypothetical protein